MKVRPDVARSSPGPAPYGMPDCLGVADRGRRARLGHRDHQVGLDRVLARPAGGRSRPGRRGRCGRRSWCPGGPGRRTRTGSPWASGAANRAERSPCSSIAISSPGSTSRTNARADDVQRRRLAGDHPAALQPAEHQRAYAVRVAGRVQRVLVHEDEAERAAQRRQHLERGGLDRQVGSAGEQRGDQRGVGGRAVGVGSAALGDPRGPARRC